MIKRNIHSKTLTRRHRTKKRTTKPAYLIALNEAHEQGKIAERTQFTGCRYETGKKETTPLGPVRRKQRPDEKNFYK